MILQVNCSSTLFITLSYAKCLFCFEGDKFSMWSDFITRYDISKQNLKEDSLFLHLCKRI